MPPPSPWWPLIRRPTTTFSPIIAPTWGSTTPRRCIITSISTITRTTWCWRGSPPSPTSSRSSTTGSRASRWSAEKTRLYFISINCVKAVKDLQLNTEASGSPPMSSSLSVDERLPKTGNGAYDTKVRGSCSQGAPVSVVYTLVSGHKLGSGLVVWCCVSEWKGYSSQCARRRERDTLIHANTCTHKPRLGHRVWAAIGRHVEQTAPLLNWSEVGRRSVTDSKVVYGLYGVDCVFGCCVCAYL